VHLIGPIGTVIWVVVLLFMPCALAVAKFYRERWQQLTVAISTTGPASGDRPLRQARRAQWVCESLDNLARWSYYGIGAAAMASLVLVPPLRGLEGPMVPQWIGLLGLQFAAVAIMLVADHNRDENREALLRKILQAVDESFSSRHGLRVRDDLTGLHSNEFWIHGLELRLRRMIFKGTPIVCLTFQIGGLKAFRELHGDEAANHVLLGVAVVLKNNVQSGSLICRYEPSSFAVAVFRCTKKRGLAIAENLLANIQFEVLDRIQTDHGFDLTLDWAAAVMPGNASTPVQLLRTCDWKMKQRIGALSRPEPKVLPVDPEAEDGKLPPVA